MNKQLSFKMPVLDEEETKMKLKKYLRVSHVFISNAK